MVARRFDDGGGGCDGGGSGGMGGGVWVRGNENNTIDYNSLLINNNKQTAILNARNYFYYGALKRGICGYNTIHNNT